MAGPLPLRAALKWGALVAAANWPVVIVDFAIESLYKLALTVPVIGGALMVAAILGADLQTVLGEGLRPTAELVIGSLATAPVALLAFLIALSLVAFGGEIVMLVVKSGTLAVLVTGERRAIILQNAPLDLERLREINAYSLATVYDACRRFARRSVTLSVWLGVAYFVVGGGYVAVISYGFDLAVRTTSTGAWPILVIVSTTVAFVAITSVNLAYDLLRVIVVTDDCDLPEAVRRLRRFLSYEFRAVIGIFGIISGIFMLAVVGSVLAAAGLALVAWVPYIGFIFVPLQMVAWIIRGLVFQYVGLAALSAYQTQYRRFAQRDSSVRAIDPAATLRA